MSLDAIVVGAGLAGLAAAHHLHRAGREVVVLEAGDAVGGRVRTDVVDGFRLDRGFQVFNTAYPEAAAVLDYDRLHLRRFVKGASVRLQGRDHRLVDPRQQPGSAPATVTSSLLPWRDKAAIAAFSVWCAYAPVERLLKPTDTTAAEGLRRAGISEVGVERFIRPFLSGVLLDPELSTSAAYTRLIWRTFVTGQVVVPASGMQAIPEQLAAGLPAGTVRLGAPVEALTRGGVAVAGGDELRASAVIVATDGSTACRLLPELTPPAWNGVTTFYHSLPAPPTDEPLLVLDPEGGLIANTVVISAAAPGYAAPGRALVSTSVVGARRDAPDLEAQVRGRLATLYDAMESDFQPVATYRVDQAQPATPPPLQLRRPVRVSPGRYVCGDWRDTSSIQGALVSGRRAARAVLRDR